LVEVNDLQFRRDPLFVLEERNIWKPHKIGSRLPLIGREVVLKDAGVGLTVAGWAALDILFTV